MVLYFRIQISRLYITYGHIDDGRPLRLSLVEGRSMGDI